MVCYHSANVTPVYKKSSKQHVANYRPISLTSVVCKTLIHHKLYRLLESNHVLCDSQFGFRANRSTTYLLLATMQDWAKTLNDHQGSHCVFKDYAKAFDSVPHERLLLKLEVYGVHCFSGSVHSL